MTGVTNIRDELTSEQIELLKTIAPGISRLGVLTTGKALVHDADMARRDADCAGIET